jgi:hypothetical protein
MTPAQIAQTRALATLKIRTALYKRYLDRQETSMHHSYSLKTRDYVSAYPANIPTSVKGTWTVKKPSVTDLSRSKATRP